MCNSDCGKSSNNKNIKKVLSGNFPKEALKKMSRRALESFVLNLVKCSSDVGTKDAEDFVGLYRGLCLKEINKPKWWPSDSIISQSLTPDGNYIMELLRFLVYKCCEFFKKPSTTVDLNNMVFHTENDENSKGIKRTYNEAFGGEFSRRRRTLMPKNITPKYESSSVIPKNNVDFTRSPVIRLEDILYQPKPKPLSQGTFLNLFGLQNNFSPNTDDLPDDPHIPPSNGSLIKFNNSSNIPFSSDLGLELKKRDNHVCPEALKNRRLERIEWYINKSLPKNTDTKYEVTYQEKKDITFHQYKFPKRQIWQHPGDVAFQMKAVYCKRLKIVLVREDLEAKQKILKKVSVVNHSKNPKLSVSNSNKSSLRIVVSRMSHQSCLSVK